MRIRIAAFYVLSAICLSVTPAHAVDNSGIHEILLKTTDAKHQQALVVSVSGDEKNQAWIGLWERDAGKWIPVWEDLPAAVGRNGLAEMGNKIEGDGKTPAGIFPLGTAFGSVDQAVTDLAYRKAEKNDFWVDDPQSPQYNQWVRGTPDAKSYETMLREDNLYKYGIVIEYNMNPIEKGKGSAIFLHVWRGPGQSTAGCVAVSEELMIKILKQLDKEKQPVILLSPRY